MTRNINFSCSVEKRISIQAECGYSNVLDTKRKLETTHDTITETFKK